MLFRCVQSDFLSHDTESSHTRKQESNIYLPRIPGDSYNKPNWLMPIPRCRQETKRTLTEEERLLGEVSDVEDGNQSAEEAIGVIRCAE
jgi:hypothetical protein